MQSEPATRADLDAAMEKLRAELASKDDLDALGRDLRAALASRDDLDALGRDLRAELASRDDLDALGRDLRAELASKNDLQELQTKVRAELAESHAELSHELKQHTKAITEEIRSWFKVLDEKADAGTQKNRDDTAELRRELEQHRDDDQAHRRPRRRSR